MTPPVVVEGIRAFAEEGISHLQMYLVPNIIHSNESFAKVLDRLGD